MNNYYNPIHTHSDASLLDGLSQIHQIVSRAKEINTTSIGLTDHGSLANTISLIKECKSANIKPIIGEEFYCSRQPANIRDNNNREHTHLLIYANNNNGWNTLLKIHNKSTEPENFYYRNRLSIREIAELTDGNISVVIGHIGSLLADLILQDDYQNCKTLLFFLCDKFGKENVWLEAQSVGVHAIPETRKILAVIRRLSKELNIPAVATPDAHYCKKEDQILQNILLCKGLGGITLEQLENTGMSAFATSDDWYIPSYDEMLNKYGSTEEELENTLKFADRISEYTNILKSPMLPDFKCPDGHNVNSWLRELCRNGWRNKIQGKISKDKEQEYVDRIKHELSVFESANLAGYFLIVEDIVRYATQQLNCVKSPGRGSSGACLTSYLLGITQIDPIKYDLIFSRFYDKSRKGALPDIDCDFPKHKREQIIQYIKDKYGKDHVAQIATYPTMKGRAALKDVFRAYGTISIDEQNKITKHLPDPAKIAAELQEMEDEEGSSSLIRYSLENDKRSLLKEWCFINNKGELEGPFAKQFQQAIYLEGTKVAQSRHAGGIIISPTPLNEICPLTYDTKTKSQICSLSLGDAESCGLVKMDCLGVITLDKIEDMVETAKTIQAC